MLRQTVIKPIKGFRYIAVVDRPAIEPCYENKK